MTHYLTGTIAHVYKKDISCFLIRYWNVVNAPQSIKSQVQVSSRIFYFGAVVVILLCGALITFQYLKKNNCGGCGFMCFTMP